MAPDPVLPQSFVPSFPPLAAFGGSPIYFTGDSALKLSVQNAAAGVTVTMTGRMLAFGATRPTPFTQTLVPATDRTVSSVVFGIGDGWLLDVQAIVSAGSPQVGQCFARLSVVHGQASTATEMFSLAADYVTAKQPVSYPGSGLLDATDSAGALRSIAGATPAAGAEILETVPTGARWELLAFHATFVTAVAVANRVPQLVIDDGVTTLFRVGAALNQAASLTYRRSWYQGAPAPYLDNANSVPMPLPTNIRLPAGARISTLTAAIAAADQWSAVQYLVREWIEGA